MSESLNEAPLAPEAPLASATSADPVGGDGPRSPGEAVQHYAQTARDVAAEDTAAAGADARPVEAPAGDTAELADVDLSEDFLAGYHEALESLGYEIPQPEPQPGDDGYAEWATGERDRLIGSMLDLGVEPQALAQNLAQFRASRAAAQQHELQQARYDEGLALHHVAQLAQTSGAEYVDPAAALALTRSIHAEVTREHGSDVAREMAPQMYQQAVNHLAGEMEATAKYGVQVAREYSSHLPNVDALDVLAAAEALYPRRLREANGDESVAFDRSFADAARQVGGDPTHPSQVTNLYSQNAHRIRQRDTSATRLPPGVNPIAAKYAATAREIAAKEGRQ